MKRILLAVSLAATAAIAATGAVDRATPPGEPKTATTRTLEAGATVIQTDAPAEQLDIYLVGFHPMKDRPSHQMEAHHFCHQVNEDFAQCALFDGRSRTANLNGIEYIISEKLYRQLDEKERQYWHPHNYEILSGQLVAPGIPGPVEKQLMKSKMNSYGKTWHVWNTGRFGQRADPLPLGEPELAWSFNRDGEAMPGLIEERDRKLDIDSAQKRESRKDLVQLARPQGGVDAISSKFSGERQAIPGVVDETSAER